MKLLIFVFSVSFSLCSCSYLHIICVVSRFNITAFIGLKFSLVNYISLVLLFLTSFPFIPFLKSCLFAILWTCLILFACIFGCVEEEIDITLSVLIFSDVSFAYILKSKNQHATCVLFRFIYFFLSSCVVFGFIWILFFLDNMYLYSQSIVSQWK